MWYRWMAIAFLTNGLSQFGARIIQDMGFAKSHSDLYLGFWYLTGFIVALIIFFTVRQKITRQEVWIGGIMGLCSCGCWFMLTSALGAGVPGYLAFPVAIGGSLSVVAMFGVIFLKEHLSVCGYFGVIAGISAMILLLIP